MTYTMKHPTYSRVRPGDMIGFSHCGCTGCWINLATWGIPGWGLSHVAIVGRHPVGGYPVLYESLSSIDKPCLIQQRIVSGLQCQSLERRVHRCCGRIWHYPLSVPLADTQQEVLHNLCMAWMGTKYDELGAFRSRELSIIEQMILRPPDVSSLFCSEWVAMVYRKLRILPITNVSDFNPNRLARYGLKCKAFCPPTRMK